MAQGLIAAALGGFGKALSSVGEMEAKKQNEAKLRKEIMAMESEERLRLDEVMHERKLARLPVEARATAEANVLGEVAGLDAANKAGLPTKKAEAAVAATTARYAAEDKAGLTAIEAGRKVQARLAELTAIKGNKLDEAESRAKYDALMTDIKVAKELGVDVAETERAAEKELARINALIKAGVPKAEAGYAAGKRLEEIRAVTEKNLITEEAGLLAKQELAKVQAMTAAGVPEAEAKLLSAKWKAQKVQRDEASAEKTQQEMNDLVTKMQNPKYTKALKTKEAIDATGSLLLQANRQSIDKKNRAKNTIEMERQIKETNNEIGRIIGIGDPKKIPDEINFLESQAKKGNKDAIEKLARIKPLTTELDALSRELRSYKRGGSDTTESGKQRPDISSFNK